MKFAYSDISGVFEWDNRLVPTLVIEDQTFFSRFLKDIYLSFDGVKTPVVLSVDDKPVDMSKYAEVIIDFINFDINRKPLINKICTALERIAVSSEHYVNTQRLLLEIERSVANWSFDFSCDIIANKISVSNIIRAIGIELSNDYSGNGADAERIIDYMELVREFEHEKLFVMVNMRSYFSDSVIESFLETVLSHEYKVLLVDSKSHSRLKTEKRLTVDCDLCEF